MRAVLLFLCAVCACRARSGSRYGFYRSMEAARRSGGGEARRVFGGAAASLSTFPAACVLLDRYWSSRCSAAVVAPRWALTAAHCISTQIAYIRFNSRSPDSSEGDVATVQYLYHHPGYRVVQEDEGHGLDVTLLHHDVGLVRTHNDMKLAVTPALELLNALHLYDPVDLMNKEVQVLGFGRTERSTSGEGLYEVRLRLVACERGAWRHCVCGAGAARGVCSGDSGGPVLYRGAQVGVTSMGPLECAAARHHPQEGATSVFTSLYKYADLVNATIYDTEDALRMRMLESGAAPRAPGSPLALLAALLARRHVNVYTTS